MLMKYTTSNVHTAIVYGVKSIAGGPLDAVAFSIDRPNETVHRHGGGFSTPMWCMDFAMRRLGENRNVINGARQALNMNPKAIIGVPRGEIPIATYFVDTVENELRVNIHVNRMDMLQHFPAWATYSGFEHQLLSEELGMKQGRSVWFADRLECSMLPASLEQVVSTRMASACNPHGYPLPDNELPGGFRMLTGVDLSTFLEDAHMLMTENLVTGLRSKWCRRVALPIVKALEHLGQANNDQHLRAPGALDLIDQCKAADFHNASRAHILWEFEGKLND